MLTEKVQFSADMKKPYIIAEVGQNHNGSLEVALDYIKTFAQNGASAIKFQTRDNKYLFSDTAYNKEYNSENAFGRTYGEHREHLELSVDELVILRNACWENGVHFMSTPFDEPSLELLCEISVDLIKVASFDIGNLPFLHRIAKTGKPIVVSVGGGKFEHIANSIDEICKLNTNLAVLHCVSEYPCPVDRLSLGSIKELKNSFPSVAIGSSDHFNGILSGPIAFTMGARVFEKHVTLNRAQKGTDHSFALEPDGFKKFVRDINRVEPMVTINVKEDLGNEPVFKKLGKSIVAKTDILSGVALNYENLSGKIFPETFIPVRESNKLIGQLVNRDIRAWEPITFDDLVPRNFK